MDELIKDASASERHPAVVQGQEELAGVKSVQIKRNMKKNSENEFVITQSTRTEMVYDTVDQARSAYLDIHDAKEEAEFDKANSHKDEPSKEEPEQKTEEDMAKDQEEHLDAKPASWDADLIRQAAGAFTSIDVDPGFYTGNIDPALPHAGFNPQQKTDEYTPGKGDGYNIGTGPDKPLLGIHDKASSEDASKNEQPGSSLLQPDFKVSPMETELRNGVRREFEHTDDAAKAVEIALDHLAEDEKYYTKLQEVMPEFGTEEKKDRTVYVSPDSKEVKEYDYEKAGRETMFPSTVSASLKNSMSISAVIDSCINKIAYDYYDRPYDVIRDFNRIKSGEITSESADYKKVVNNLIDWGYGYDLLASGIITHDTINLFWKAVKNARDNGKDFELLYNGIVTQNDGKLFDDMVLNVAYYGDVWHIERLLGKNIVTRSNNIFTKFINELIDRGYGDFLIMSIPPFLTQDDGDLFIKAFNNVLEDGNAYKLLSYPAVRDSGDLFSRAVSKALEDGHAIDLLENGYVQRSDGNIFLKAVKEALNNGDGDALLTNNIITKEDGNLYFYIANQFKDKPFVKELIRDKWITEDELAKADSDASEEDATVSVLDKEDKDKIVEQ